MKRFYIAIVFLVLTLAACFKMLSHLERNTLAIKNEIALMREAVEAGNEAEADAAMQKLIIYWNNEKMLFHALAGSTYCFPFECALNRVAVVLAQRESSEFLTELSELDSHIDQLWDTQVLHPKNLF